MAVTQKVIDVLQDKNYFTACKQEFNAAAIAVANEDPATENHVNRLNLANMVIKNQLQVDVMCQQAMTNSTLQGKINAHDPETDGAFSDWSDIAYIVTTVFNGIANAYAA